MKSYKHLLCFVCALLAGGNLAGFNEGWRLTNARKTSYGWGYSTSWNHYNYAFCYDTQAPSTLDSLSITHWQQVEETVDPLEYLPPYIADFSTVESADSYTIRTAWLNPEFNNTPYIRQYTRSLNGRWLEDNLFSADGTHLWHKQYFYNAQGHMSSIRLSDHETSPGPEEWLIENTYDTSGRRINQYIYQDVGNTWTPRYRCLYHYVEGEVLPSSYRISEHAPFVCRKWDYLGVEVFSDFKLDRIYVNTHNGSDWVLSYTQVYLNYSFNGSELLVERKKLWSDNEWDFFNSYGTGFYPSGMRSRDVSETLYADAFSSKTIIYTWEEVEDTATHDEQNPPSPPRLLVYPNPFMDSVTFKAEAPILNLSVYDLRGRLIHTSSASSQSLDWQALDPQGRPLPAGIYFIRATTPQGVITRKVIKYGS